MTGPVVACTVWLPSTVMAGSMTMVAGAAAAIERLSGIPPVPGSTPQRASASIRRRRAERPVRRYQ